jgi:hypothetical protein
VTFQLLQATVALLLLEVMFRSLLAHQAASGLGVVLLLQRPSVETFLLVGREAQ